MGSDNQIQSGVTAASATVDHPPSPEVALPSTSPGPRTGYRSGAVARMLRMPVATLRIWERRYQVAAPATTAAGHRLYSAADIQRLALLKQLSDLGHAIGSIAALDLAQLQAVAATHASTVALARGPLAAHGLPWRVVVVGAGLAARLQRPSLARQLARPLDVVAQCDALAVAQPEGSGAAGLPRADLLLLHTPGMVAELPHALAAAAQAWRAPASAVLYGFAPDAVCRALADAGVALLREPQDDRHLAAWLNSLMHGAPPAARPLPVPAPSTPTSVQLTRDPLWLGDDAIAPRRYDDATLSDFAGLSSTIACECPRHVAELLMQLSHFEAYSLDCEQRSPADAALHAYLHRVAATSRALFETALERLAIQEGLMLPP